MLLCFLAQTALTRSARLAEMPHHEMYAERYRVTSRPERADATSVSPLSLSLATPSIPASKGVFSALGTAIFDRTPPEQVWAAVLDFASYPKWNKFTPSIEPSWSASGSGGALAVGQVYKMQYRLTASVPAAPIDIRITQIDNESRTIAWLGCPRFVPSSLLVPEKAQRVYVNAEGKTVVEVWETQAGMLAHAAKHSVGSKLDGMNQGIADGLKHYLEGAPTDG